MADVTHALRELGYRGWKVLGDPRTEDEFRSSFKIMLENGTESSNSADWPEGLTWEAVETKLNELVAAEPMKALREERNRRLAETDWWANSDLTMTAEQTDYRQALRDITETFQNLDSVIWPNKP
jgi:hypothetical protein